MEKIKIGESIRLEDGKEYVCFFELEDSRNNYICLVTETRPVEVQFAKYNTNENDESIIIIGEKKEKEYVLELFQKKMMN